MPCIDHDSIYEVVDPALEIVIKRMLKLPPEAGPVVISVPLFILSYIVSRQPIKQISILGVSILTDKFTTLAIKTGVGIIGGSIFFFNPVGIVSLTGAILTTAVILNIAQGIDNVKCNNLVSKLPMERVSSEKTIGFLEELPEKSPKIFIKGSEDKELYIPSSDTDGDCSSEYKPVEVKKLNRNKVETQPQNRIRRKCEKEYVPLKERTKTLADLKKEDSTENREKAAPFIKRYEDRRRRIMNKRTEL